MGIQELLVLFLVMQFFVEVWKQPINKGKKLLFIVDVFLVGEPPIVGRILDDNIANGFELGGWNSANNVPVVLCFSHVLASH